MCLKCDETPILSDDPAKFFCTGCGIEIDDNGCELCETCEEDAMDADSGYEDDRDYDEEDRQAARMELYEIWKREY